LDAEAVSSQRKTTVERFTSKAGDLGLEEHFRLVGLISAVTCALLLAACGQNKVAERPPEPGDTAVARVNGR
jgi:hypothetical protein